MTLMKRRSNELEWPTWFGRPLADFPTLWKDMLEDTSLKLEEFEADGTLVVRAEMPGIDPEKDVDITIADGRLHICAERRSETKTDDKSGYRSDSSTGRSSGRCGYHPGLPNPTSARRTRTASWRSVSRSTRPRPRPSGFRWSGVD